MCLSQGNFLILSTYPNQNHYEREVEGYIQQFLKIFVHFLWILIKNLML